MTDTITLFRASIEFGGKILVTSVEAKETKYQFRFKRTESLGCRTQIGKERVGVIDHYCTEAWGFSRESVLLILMNGLFRKNAALKEEIDRNSTKIDLIHKLIEERHD